MKQIILFSLSFILSICVKGQNSDNEISWDIYGGAGVSKLDTRIVETYSSIEPSASFGAALGGGMYYKYVGLNLEIGGFSIDDSNSFSQLNTSGNNSTTFGWHATPSIGGIYEIKNIDLILNLGYNFVTAKRAIEDCADCRTEDVPLNNGATIRPKLAYHFPKMYLFTSYEHYFSDHMQSLFLIGFGYRTNRL